MAGIAFLRRLLMKQAMKRSKDASGIMTLNKGLVNDVDNTVKKWVDSAKRQGQDIDKMGEQEIKYIIELNKPKGPVIGEHRVIDATSSEGKKITEDLFGKKGEVIKVDFDKSNKWFKGKSKGVEDVSFAPGKDKTGTIVVESPSQIIARMKTMTPIEAMKEANSVIGRRGKYKNLTEKQSKKILKDTEDHIFERDIKPDPEDLAHGGRTGSGLNYLLGEDDQNTRVPYGNGDRVWTQDDFNQYLKDRGQRDKEKQKKDFLDDFEKWKKWKETEGGTIDFAADGGRIGLKKGSKKSWRDRIAGWTGGTNVMAGELGLETWDLLNNLLQSGGLYAEGGRTGFGIGGMSRRAFLKLMGGAAAGTAAAKSGLLGLLKSGKPAVIKELTSVPIKDISGMPAWFKPLVNQVIKKGKQIESGADRVIVHSSELPGSKTKLYVTQELDTGNVMVDVGIGKHGFKEGHLGQPVRLEYKAAEDIMSGPSDEPFKVGERDPLLRIKSSVHEDLVGSGLKGDPKTLNLKPGKTKEEFWVEEAEFTGGHPENIKFEEFSSEKFGQHGSNFDEVEKFATGTVKKKTVKESIKAERAHWTPEGDMASGGRVPLGGGGLATMLGE